MAERIALPLSALGTRSVSAGADVRASGTRISLEHYFEVSVLLLLTSGFVTIATTGTLDVIAVVFVSIALVVRGWFLLAGKKLAMPQSWDSYFTFGYVLFYAADYLLLSRGFVNATVHLVLFSMVVKIFSVRRDRDYVYLTVLAFMEVLAASVLTVDTMFLAAFTVFSLLAVNTFVTFEIRRSWQAPGTKASGGADLPSFVQVNGRLSRALLCAAFVLAVGIVAMASGIFFVLPRINAGYFSRFVPKNRIESGFSESVQLGQIGEIQQSSTVVMHVQIHGDRSGAHDLKWRGVALSLFDGRQWLNPLPRTQAKPELTGCFNVLPDEGSRSRFVCSPSLIRPAHLIRYRVLMEPIGTNIFFLAPLPESVSGNFRAITVDAGGSVFNADSGHTIAAYEATSDLSSPPPEQLRAAATAYSGAVRNRYLQLPRIDARIPPLARQVTSGAESPYDKAVAIEEYLRNNFQYTLKLSEVAPKDPIAEFLFERKAGHCEYFASTMAIMLRTLGIPSRIVNGFRGGEFNDISGSYILRARDAHSWVEVYFPGQGWVSFDPTPAGAAPSAMQHDRFALYMDAMREFWREWVVNYDFSRQNDLGNTGMSRSLRALDSLRQWTRSKYLDLLRRGFDVHAGAVRNRTRWTYSTLAAGLLLLVVLNARTIRRATLDWRLIRRPESAPIEAASLWYRKMTSALARRKGYRRSPAQTPEEFLRQISDPALRAVVALFVSHYERARFGASAEDAVRLPSLYDTIRATMREA